MIPKIIHYCWLSGDPFPETIANYMATWKEKLPDYEFILWDTNRFDIESNIWVKQAFDAKKYAFAADYIRLYAVYNFGGIYMDTDIQVVKSFDDLLHLPYFAGTEGKNTIEAGVFGAEKGTSWLNDCLQYYEGRSFLKPDGLLDILPLPKIIMHCLEKSKVIKTLPKELAISALNQNSPNAFIMFPDDFFCAKNQGTGVVKITEKTYCIHHFAMSWMPGNYKFLPNLKRTLMRYFSVGFIQGVVEIFYLREIRNMLIKKQSKNKSAR